MYALLSKTLAVRPLLQQLLHEVGLASFSSAAEGVPTSEAAAAGKKEYLLLLMLRDLLLSPKGIEGGGQLRRELLAHESQLRHLFNAAAAEASAGAAAAATAAAIPRYLRVNRRLWGAAAAAEFLRGNSSCISWALLDPLLPCVVAVPATAARLLQQQPQQQQTQQQQQKQRRKQNQQQQRPEEAEAAGKDSKEGQQQLVPQEQLMKQQHQQEHQQGLLLHELVPRGFVSLQDRASCTAAAAAAVAEGDIVLEACAAPGSKTLHIIGTASAAATAFAALLFFCCCSDVSAWGCISVGAFCGVHTPDQWCNPPAAYLCSVCAPRVALPAVRLHFCICLESCSETAAAAAFVNATGVSVALIAAEAAAAAAGGGAAAMLLLVPR